MKKVLLFAVSAMILFSVFSCGDKKATNIAELKKKYDGKEFKNCDEFLSASEEMFDVYFATIDKAVEGDENAKKEIDEFEEFMNGFEGNSEKFEKECPDKFDDFEAKFEKKMEEYMPKIMKLYGLEGMFDEMDGGEWEEGTENVVENVED